MVRNESGYGVWLDKPDAFIWAVIMHFFSPLPRWVSREDIVHEGRVALLAQDLRYGDATPETTGRYWWRVGQAVGSMLWRDYGIPSMFTRCRGPFNSAKLATEPDSAEDAAAYLEKQRQEPIPQVEVETKEWVDHYLGLAEGILLDHDDPEQGERDLIVFGLWVDGHSPKEIASRPEIDWLQDQKSVDRALRRIIHRLWEFFGVDLESHVMVVGEFNGNSKRTKTSDSPKTRFANWISQPGNRERHNEKCRQRMRAKRAEAKARKAAAQQS